MSLQTKRITQIIFLATACLSICGVFGIWLYGQSARISLLELHQDDGIKLIQQAEHNSQDRRQLSGAEIEKLNDRIDRMELLAIRLAKIIDDKDKQTGGK